MFRQISAIKQKTTKSSKEILYMYDMHKLLQKDLKHWYVENKLC
jgi:hypothetical protein